MRITIAILSLAGLLATIVPGRSQAYLAAGWPGNGAAPVLVYPVPVVYSTPVIYEAPVVYYAPVYYLGGAALAIAGCVPQRVCAAPSTVVCIGGPHGNYAYSRCGSCGSTVTCIGSRWARPH